MFNQGQKSSLELLLKVWRREKNDWRAIEEELTPQQVCHRCGILKYKECYAPSQWDKPHKRGNCKACVKLRQEENTPFDCSKCWEWKGAEAFQPKHRSAHSNGKRVCLECVETRMCIKCQIYKPYAAFTKSEWEHAGWKKDPQGTCTTCMNKAEKYQWQCKSCKLTLEKSFFSNWCLRYGHHKTKLVRCNTCIAAMKKNGRKNKIKRMQWS